MKRMVRLGAAVLLTASALHANLALAHAVVKSSVPPQGAVLAVAPKEVTITFNEKIEKLFSSMILKNAAGATISTSKARVDPVNPAILRLAAPTLGAGQYVVHWTAVGHDGHRLAGDIRFSVK